ncbi:hypothetical protein PghCCS26_23590 [Paenibacillus glycanilyticus]|uniref:DUF2313 domain-containing protein n=1 Tax=Paenibacillus glycanilyticus TaxID=126569 RepID=A0ABQ6NJE6_9BACL|nr:YmfQ family protein [Paenibacillus glycanilyticus]GMK45231.1 hypothetical protein PghCCS26_23590 [Paenibacillus glycanilyticus]
MAYGNEVYGALAYGAVEGEDGNSNLNGIDLLAYLPSYYREITEMKELQETAGYEISDVAEKSNDLLDQSFIDTATWGLTRWESELDIAANRAQSYERRREQLKAKLYGSGTTTKQMIIDTAAAFSGGEVAVNVYPEQYLFEIVFVGSKGIPPNMPGFIQMLEDIKPAHLAYSFKYSYTVWDNLAELSWGDAHAKTWSELKVYEGGTQ